MIDQRLLRAFVTIADAGSFTAAAERLHTTQSTVSQQLNRLEQAVGRILIDRTNRPVQPTEEGERLLGYARRMLTLQHEMEELFTDTLGTLPIRIGLPDDIVTASMSEAFANFAKAHPDVRLDVTTGLSRDLTQRFRSAEFDIVVVKEPAPGADCHAYFPEAVGWIESSTSPRTWADPIPLVTFPVGGLYREAMFDRLERERRRFYVSFTASSLTNVLVAVSAGLGISLVPLSATRDYHVRTAAFLGAEKDMVVSVYAWQKSGPAGDIADRIAKELYHRDLSPRS